MLVVMKGK